MAKYKVPSQASSGKDTFSDSLVGVQITDGSSQLTNTNFALDRIIPEKDSKNFRTSPFSEFLTLDTLVDQNKELSDVGIDLSKEKEADKKIRFRSAKNDAGKSLYGSLSKRLEVSVKNIISKYPAGFLIDKERINYIIPYTLYNITFDKDREITSFSVESSRIFNPLDIELKKPITPKSPEEELSIKNFYSSFKKYVIEFNNQTYQIDDYQESNNLNEIKFKIKGNPFSGLSAYSQTILVRPSNSIFEEFYNNLDEIEQQLLNRESNPKYTAYFNVLKDTIDGSSTDIVKVEVTWPTYVDGWNIKIDGIDFDFYLADLKEIGDQIDDYKSNLFIRFLTSPQLYEFDTDEKKAESVFQLYGQNFDRVKKYIDNIAYMRNVSYDGINNLPDILLKNLAENLGITTVDLFDEKKLDDIFYNRPKSNYQGQDGGKNLVEAEYEFYRRLLVNLAWIYKSKGTRASINFFLRFLGAPDPLIVVNEYIYKVVSLPNSSDLESDIYDVLQRSKVLTTGIFSPTTFSYTKESITGLTTFNRDGYPVDETTLLPRRAFDETSDIFFQKGAGWYDMTLNHRSVDILDEENSILTGRTKTLKTKSKSYTNGEAYFDVFRTLPGLDTGYGLDPAIDNVKSEFNNDNSQYILNRKNIDAYLSPSRSIDYDIWRKSRDLLLTFGTNTLYPQTGVTFAEFLDKTIHTQLKNSHVIRYKKNYIALEDVYTSYFNTIGFTPYQFIDSHEFIQKMSPYWMQVLDQLIPSSTLWTGGVLITNNFFGRPKYKYNIGCQAKTFEENLYPDFEKAISEDLETILGEEENFRGLINITGITYCPIIEIDGQVFSGSSYCILFSGATNTNNSVKLFNPAPMTGCTIIPDSGTTGIPLICDFKDHLDPDIDKAEDLWKIALSGLVENVVNKYVTGYTAGYVNYQPFLNTTGQTYTWEYKPKLKLEYFTDIDGKEKVRFTSIKYDFNDCSVEDYFLYRFDAEYKPINPTCLVADVTISSGDCPTDYCPQVDLVFSLTNGVGVQKGGDGSSFYKYTGCELLSGSSGTTSNGISFTQIDPCSIQFSAVSLGEKIQINFFDAANCETKLIVNGFQKKYEHDVDSSYYQEFVIDTYFSGTSVWLGCAPCTGLTHISSQTAVTFVDNFQNCVLIPKVSYGPSYNYGLLSNSRALRIISSFPLIQIQNGTIDYNAIMSYINVGAIEIIDVKDINIDDNLLTANYLPCSGFSNNSFKIANVNGYSFTYEYDYNKVKSIECLGSVKKSIISGLTSNGSLTVIEVLPTTKLKVYTNKIIDGKIITKTNYFFDERIPEHLQVRGEEPIDPCCPYPEDYLDNNGDYLINVDEILKHLVEIYLSGTI